MSSLVTKQTHQKTDPSETNPFFYFLFGVLGGGGRVKEEYVVLLSQPCHSTDPTKRNNHLFMVWCPRLGREGASRVWGVGGVREGKLVY